MFTFPGSSVQKTDPCVPSQARVQRQRRTRGEEKGGKGGQGSKGDRGGGLKPRLEGRREKEKEDGEERREPGKERGAGENKGGTGKERERGGVKKGGGGGDERMCRGRGGEAAAGTGAPLGSRGLRSTRGRPGRRARPPLTFQDEGVDVPVDAQEVALPPEARIGGEERPAALGVQPTEPQQRAPGLGVGAPGAAREQPAPEGGRVPQRQVR